MDELAYQFRRGSDELRQEGRHEGQVLVLRRLIARKFGEVTAGQLSEALDELTGLDNIDRVTDALLECGTGEEFIKRISGRRPPGVLMREVPAEEDRMTSNSPRTETAYGVDGCRKGWFYFALVPSREPEWGVVEEVAELVTRVGDSDRIFIDIPIGLPNGGEGRLCDSEARRKLAPHRTSSVFPVPVRSALTAETYEEASEKNRKASGKKLSKQTYAILPKIKEVDSVLRDSAKARRVVREVHPEICFWALAGSSPMRHNKKTGRGFHERLTLLERFHASAVKCFDEIRAGYRRRDLADDDILDAMAVAITASADRGALRTLPELPVEDSCGLPMEMVYAPASAFAM